MRKYVNTIKNLVVKEFTDVRSSLKKTYTYIDVLFFWKNISKFSKNCTYDVGVLWVAGFKILQFFLINHFK